MIDAGTKSNEGDNKRMYGINIQFSRWPGACHSRCAFSMVEALISLSILAFIFAAMISSMIYSNKCARLNTNSIMAKNIAQGFFEKYNTGKFTNIQPNATITTTSWIDQVNNIPCNVTVVTTGFGSVTAVSGSSITDSAASWRTNQWAGCNLYIVKNTGSGYYYPITSNTNNTINITGNFTINPTVDSTTPSNSSQYMISNGKSIQITTSWTYMGKAYTQTIGSLVINSNNQTTTGGRLW